MPKFKIIILLLAVAVGSSFSSLSQQVLSLEEAVQRTLENNFGIRIATEQENIARNNNTWGQAGAYPSLSLLLSNGNSIADQSRNPTAFLQTRLEAYSITGSAEMNWLLFGGFRVRSTKEQLQLLENLSGGNTDLIVENALQGVVSAYYMALLERERAGVLRQISELSFDRLEYVRQRKEIGVSTTFESLQFETAALADSTALLVQEQNYRTALRNLNLVMGEDPELEAELSDTMGVPLFESGLAELKQIARNDNRNLRNQMLNTLLIQEQRKSAQSGMYPQLSFKTGFGDTRSSFRAGVLEGEGATIAYFGNFTLSFNLFNGGNTARAVKNAGIQEEIARLSAADLERNVLAQLSASWEMYGNQLRIYELSSRSARAASTRLELSRDRYNSGVINSLEFREAQMAYLNAELQRLQSLFAINAAGLDIRRLCGNLSEPE